MTTTALLIVDLQNDYFPGGRMALVDPEAAAQNAARLMETFRANDWPVISVQHIMPRSPAPFFEPGTEGAEIHPLAAPLEGETVVVKQFPNSFRDTELQQVLQAAGVAHLVIAGAMSHMCIDATTRAAADLGYTCTVAHDACATRDLEFNGVAVPAAQVHASFMSALGSYGTIADTETVIGTLFP